MQMALDALSLARFSVTLAFLTAASWGDVKTRTVNDRYWQVLGVVGLAFLAYEMHIDGSPSAHYLLLFPIALLFYDPYIDREPLFDAGKVCWPAAAAFALAAAATGASFYLGGPSKLLIILAMFLLVYVLYFTNVIHGGADAKALMSIALAIPWYPNLPGLPILNPPPELVGVIDYSFPFVMLVLMMASLSVMLLPIYNGVVNLKRGTFVFPMAFFGRRCAVADAEKAQVWPMERLIDGRLERTMFPKRGRNLKMEYDALRAAGISEVWVTYKIPFIVPITFGLVLAGFLGNAVYWVARLIW